MSTHPLLKIALRLAGCAAVTWLAWGTFGLFSVVFMAPLFGVALARPILDLAEESAQATRRAAWRGLHGRHFQYKGFRVEVTQDEDDRRCLRLADVRKIVSGLPADAVLRSVLPGALSNAADANAVSIEAGALLRYLQKATDPGSLRFKLWLEREEINPTQGRSVGNPVP
jgi:hypothetical protein